jgi:hypothetical protein
VLAGSSPLDTSLHSLDAGGEGKGRRGEARGLQWAGGDDNLLRECEGSTGSGGAL